MSELVLTCCFTAHSYQGIRLDESQREVLEWPPSPARLHQSLMSVALKVPSFRDHLAYSHQALNALRWLERQPSPEIEASKIEEDPGTLVRFRVAIPQNNPAKSDLTKSSMLLAPALRVRVPATPGPLKVDYHWRIDTLSGQDLIEQHLPILRELAAQVRYLGRAEDQAEMRICLRDTARNGGEASELETWRPSDQSADIELQVTKEGSTDGLVANFCLAVPARTRKSPASRFLNVEGYVRDSAAGFLPIEVGIFNLMDDTHGIDAAPLSCDPESAGVWRSRIRELAVKCAQERERWDDPDLAVEIITGHAPGESKRTAFPHLAFVPVPSLSLTSNADGRVRRIALLGYAPANLKEEAAEIYRMLFSALDGESISFDRSGCRLRRIAGPATHDRVWSQFIRSSRYWHSVTPVAIARKYTVPTHSPDGLRILSSNERHLRKLSEWTALLRSSLRHIGLPEDLADKSSFVLTPTPLIRSTERAERYRPPGESALFTHVGVEFDQPVRGPLVLGDRRYLGFGLLLPS